MGPLSPTVIGATNRGICQIRGCNILSPHGLPADLLDRLLIVRTLPNNDEEVVQVLALRAQIEEVVIDRSLALLEEVSLLCSLRHAILLLTPAMMIAKINMRKTVHLIDIEKTHHLFLDTKLSANLLLNQEQKFIY